MISLHAYIGTFSVIIIYFVLLLSLSVCDYSLIVNLFSLIFSIERYLWLKITSLYTSVMVKFSVICAHTVIEASLHVNIDTDMQSWSVWRFYTVCCGIFHAVQENFQFSAELYASQKAWKSLLRLHAWSIWSQSLNNSSFLSSNLGIHDDIDCASLRCLDRKI